MTAAGKLLILGATGDLTGRYLLPALAELAEAGLLPDDLGVVGVARDDWDADRFREHAAGRLARYARSAVSAPARHGLIRRLDYLAGDVTDPAVVSAAVAGTERAVVVYLALPPAVFPPVLAALAASRLPAASRLVVEKPFGSDLASAQTLNRLLQRSFSEQTVFRMDHFLGKQTVQNLLGLRFANRVFEPLWHRTHIERVDVVWDETVALEGRAGYYDSAGALRDMIQNHLLQLLCLIAMEQPARFDERCLRDRKVEALRAVRRLSRDEVATLTVRGRYQAGRVAGREIPDYVAEPGVDGSRGTETFADTTFFVDNDRWHGVPFRLRTGKALAADRREIRIAFRPVAELPFVEAVDPPQNRLTLQLDPDRMVLDIALNGAGDPFALEPGQLDSDFPPQELSAYARLLLDVFAGDPVLSIRGDEAEESWRIVEPVLATWETGAVPLLGYPAGSTGPTAA